MAIMDSPLTEAANKLHLKAERHEAFARLALHHVRHTATGAAPGYGSSAHLNAAVRSFLEKYGPAIWPGYAPHRGHLTTSSTVTAGPQRGLLYAKAANLVRADLKAWKAANEGREPTEDEAVLASPLGRLLKNHFEVLMNVAGEAYQEAVGEQELLKAVLSETAAVEQVGEAR